MSGLDRFHVIYLTGAPATGKSTLMAALQRCLAPMVAFSYSKELADLVSQRDAAAYSQKDMRSRSSGVISPGDVDTVDNALVKLVAERRESAHVVIDSHPVTKESYGFRVTPFASERLDAIRPTMIVTLYASPAVIIGRIAANSMGRPTPTEYEAELHNHLQGAVAVIYGMRVGVPVYFLDSNQPVQQLLAEVIKRATR